MMLRRTLTAFACSLLLLVQFAAAQESAVPPEDIASLLGEAGVDALAQPLQEAVQPLLTWLKIVLGGVFGLSFFMLILRIYYERKKVNLLKDIRFDLDRLNLHFGAIPSAHRKGFFGRLWAKIKR